MKISYLSLFAVLALSNSASALTTDSDQPVYIDSDSQRLNLKSNQVTFLGNVTLTQGSINIKADKIIVIRDSETGNVNEIQGYGNLSTFSQETDEGDTLYGEAKQLLYKMSDETLTMIESAKLSQEDSVIKSSKIRYKIAEQTLIADSDKNQRVSTVFHPNAEK
ncbi:lipopolysaccharide transport periplasmic protein LptA [Vibrio sp. RC27]